MHERGFDILMRWWQTGVIYQIYPRSFQDANGDGIGDLAGIEQRLWYLRELGVDAIWLSPIYPSPMADFGYDIKDYTDVDPTFGTLDQFDRLLESAHALGLKLILDFVPNHTSSQHPWFLDSRSSRHNPKRDWYIWRDAAGDGGPPNNWLSDFGGPAWAYDSVTDQYYCHTFLAEQPDLNWRNPAVRNAMYDVMRFWLRRGVDGFRVDVIWHLIKDEQFRDNPPNPDFTPNQPPNHALLPLYTTDRPEVHDLIRDMRSVVDEFSDRVLIGEIYLPTERLVHYYGRDLRGLHLPFNFALLQTKWHASTVARLVQEYEEALPRGGWPNWVLGNHDRPRIASRVGALQARVAAMLLLTLRGTPTIYYGDELGMEQVAIPRSRLQDPLENNVPGRDLGRDGCRTPMQWTSDRYGGFSSVEPWLPLEEGHVDRNVSVLGAESTSIYNLHRELLVLRRKHSALQSGSYRSLGTSGGVLMFMREDDRERLLVALNMTGEPATLEFRSGEYDGRLLLSTFCDRSQEKLSGSMALRPDEGLLLALSD